LTTLAELRARAGKMSQRELAEKVGVTQATISNWEKEPKVMDGYSLLKISSIFNISTDELLGISTDKKF